VTNSQTVRTPQEKLWRRKEVRDYWKFELLRRSHTALRIGIVLADERKRGGYAWPIRKKLMEEAHVSAPHNVSRALTELEKAGLITRYVYGPELSLVFPVKLDPDACQSVYVLHQPGDAARIREWHEKRGIHRRSESSPRRTKHRVTKTPPKPFEVISFTGKTKESPQSG
jgi:hypothetical protein